MPLLVEGCISPAQNECDGIVYKFGGPLTLIGNQIGASTANYSTVNVNGASALYVHSREILSLFRTRLRLRVGVCRFTGQYAMHH